MISDKIKIALLKAAPKLSHIELIDLVIEECQQAQKEKTSWTLEDVKKSWKSGYQAGIEQAQPEIKQSAERVEPVAEPHKWVGLTDEEILIMSRYDLEYAALIGEVQRRLKEKNT